MSNLIEDNIKIISCKIEEAVKRRLVNNGEIKFIAVTKTQPVEALKAVEASGIMAFGENRVQEAQKKIPCFSENIEWHLIGHLQTNKAKAAVQHFSLIHSVDSKRIANALNDAAAQINKIQDVLIQVNVADEESKFGIAAEEVLEMLTYVEQLKNLKVCGLMNIAPYEEDAEKVRPIFKEMYRLFAECKQAVQDKNSFVFLSMGMTNDYQVAVEEGANLLRIGSAIFGERIYAQ